ncbi:MAG: aspartate-semialdehyde dehydrogenase [Phycisphaeraceae bacterium]
MSITAPNVAIVGVTGAVGQEFLKVLAQRDFAIGRLKLLASSRSAGKPVEFRGKPYTVEQLAEDSFQGVDLALFSAGGSISRQFVPIAAEAGATVVDNTSAFRMAEGVPLVVPEVNPEAVEGIAIGGPGKGRIIANPNCSTIIMLVPVTPLHRAAGVKRMVVSTYQSASGAGAAAMAELEQQTRDVLSGKPPTCNAFAVQYAFNLFSHNSQIGPEGYNSEEMKMVRETHKIWNDTSPRITATCVRVPVMRAHAESINLEFENRLDEDEARDILRNAPGVCVIDDRDGNRFPTPLDATDQDEVYVGRIRNDISRNGDATDGLDLFVCGDQIRKGAALNAVQIAELLL